MYMHIHYDIMYVRTYVCVDTCNAMQCNATQRNATQPNATQCMYTTYLMYANILLCTIDYVFNIYLLLSVHVCGKKERDSSESHLMIPEKKNEELELLYMLFFLFFVFKYGIHNLITK